MIHTSIMFDTLQYSKKLRNAGFTEKQAEIQAEAFAEIIEDKLVTKKDLKDAEIGLKQDIKNLEIATKQAIKNLEIATKQDIKNLEIATKQDIKSLEISTKQDLKSLEKEFRLEMKVLENRITIKTGSIMAFGLSLLVTLMKILNL